MAAAALLVLMSATLAAFPPEDNPRRAFRQAMKAYMMEEVMPFAKEQRVWLESQLTAEEQATIATIREQLKAQRKTRKDRPRGSDRALSPEEISEMRAKQKQHRDLLDQAWQIVDNHKPSFDKIMAETLPKRQQWRDDIHNIAEKHLGDSIRAPRGMGHPNMGKGDKPVQGRPGIKGDKRGRSLHKAPFMLSGPQAEVRFLLWDAEKPFPAENDADGREVVGFPNPVADTFTIDFGLDAPGQVSIVIVNRQGEEVKALGSFEGVAGENQIAVDVSDLERGMYFYRITTPDGKISKRFLKE